MTAMFVDDMPVGLEMMQRYLEVVERIERRFIAVHPEASRNRDFRRGKVQLLTRALFRMTMYSRRASLRVFARMLRADAPTALRHLRKYVAVALFGPRAWKMGRWWRSRGQEQRT
jgi:hypothetical protein